MIFAWVGMCPASPPLCFPQAWLMFQPQEGEIWGWRGSPCSLFPFLSLPKGMERNGRPDFPRPLGEKGPIRELWFH